MKTRLNLLRLLFLAATSQLSQADELASQATNSIVAFGEYSAIRETNGNCRFINPSEFWRGAWKEDTNGWRVQLRVSTNKFPWMPQPVNSNAIVTVDWGSVIKSSGGGYMRTPNGKLAKIELLDSTGVSVPIKPGAGSNLLGQLFCGMTYPTNQPAWAEPSGGSLNEKFPKAILASAYPYGPGGTIVGEIGAFSNEPPEHINILNLTDLYNVTNEGNYTLTVQPVLYKLRLETALKNGSLDRVDLPSVSTKIYLRPKLK